MKPVYFNCRNRNSRNLLLARWLTCLLFFLPGFINAAACFSPSPSSKNNIDIYEPIETTVLTEQQHDVLKQFFKRMIGKWEGKAVSVLCKGTLDAVNMQSTDYTAETNIETTLDAGAKISYQLHSDKEKKRIQDTLQLYLTASRLGITENTAAGDVQILNLTRSFLVYLRKYVVRTVAGGAIAMEEVRSLAVYDHSFMMETLEYSNGLLAQKMTWTLERK